MGLPSLSRWNGPALHWEKQMYTEGGFRQELHLPNTGPHSTNSGANRNDSTDASAITDATTYTDTNATTDTGADTET
jgi:hypothetical protein